MFKKLLSLMVLTVATCLSATGATPPTISSGDQVTWYLLRFLNGNNVLEAKADGAEVLTASAMASDAQLWKIEGNEAEGYTLTSKNGMKLYTTTTQKEGMFHAAKAPTSSIRALFGVPTPILLIPRVGISPPKRTLRFT